MEEVSEHNPPTSASAPSSSSSPTSADVPSSSSSPSSQVHEEEPPHELPRNEGHRRGRGGGRHQSLPPANFSYRVNVSISDSASTAMRDDVWSCLVVLVTFWFFASMTLILGFYGSVNLQLGPNCSRIIQANQFFVQSIKAQEVDKSKSGPMLYGFQEPPSLDVEVTWSETHQESVAPALHKEWIYFLNRGSKMNISYNVESPSSSPLSLVIAQGRESLVEWIEDPSYPNTTLSWNIIHGSGRIQQEILKPSNYYVAIGNLNSEEVQVQLNFTVKAFQYNTTHATCKCSLSQQSCTVKLSLLKKTSAVLASPGPEQGTQDDYWHVKLSYAPRWLTYFIGSGAMTVVILLAFRICNIFQGAREDGTGLHAGGMESERSPLLSHKDDDLSSGGSSYDSISHDEEDLEEWLAVASLEGRPQNEGESSKNHGHVCAICCDALRDCFFLPCGHCAACFTCGSRIAEEAGNCPICRRKIKKVRKIFTV